MFTLLTFASAKPITTAVESTSSGDTVAPAVYQNRELVQSDDIMEPKYVLPLGSEPLHYKQTEKGHDSRDVDMVHPHGGLVELCCKSGCVECSNLACPPPKYDCLSVLSLIIYLASLFSLSCH